MNDIKGKTSWFGSVILVLPSDIGKYLSSFLIIYKLFFNCFHFYVYSVIENCIFHHCKFLRQAYIHKVDLLDLLTILLSTVKILLKLFIEKSKKNIQKHRSKKSQISLFKISHIHKKFCQVDTRVKKSIIWAHRWLKTIEKHILG